MNLIENFQLFCHVPSDCVRQYKMWKFCKFSQICLLQLKAFALLLLCMYVRTYARARVRVCVCVYIYIYIFILFWGGNGRGGRGGSIPGFQAFLFVQSTFSNAFHTGLVVTDTVYLCFTRMFLHQSTWTLWQRWQLVQLLTCQLSSVVRSSVPPHDPYKSRLLNKCFQSTCIIYQ